MDITTLDKQLIADAWTSRELYANLEALCDFGSRFAGSPSEAHARDFIRKKFHQYGLAHINLDPFEYKLDRFDIDYALCMYCGICV